MQIGIPLPVKGRRRIMHNPTVEQRNWSSQLGVDDEAYRRQIKYLWAQSPFYGDKLAAHGLASADDAGGLQDIAALPFTVKDELRASRSEQNPIGTHLAVPMQELNRIFSTSGTTGTPSYIPVTKRDLEDWIETCSRSYTAAGLRRGDAIVTTFNAGPFVAGAVLDALNQLGLCHIPVGNANTERLMSAIKLLKPRALSCTPSYALYLAEWGKERRMDVRSSSIEQIVVAGEPGGGEPAMRARLEEAWGAKVTEAMGIGDVSISLWGECSEQHGMHFCGRSFVHFELIDPDTGEPVPIEDGAEGELVLTHLKQQAAPLLRFRTRDHVKIWTSQCRCGRTAPRIRCIGRTDDMLIVRGVNLFPSAVREVVNGFAPAVSGVISIRPSGKGVKQSPPLKVMVELGKGATKDAGLAERIKADIRAKLVVTTNIEVIPFGELPRSEYKSKLVDYSEAEGDPVPSHRRQDRGA